MELRQLRYFVAVAEELHFTRAAERLHIGQPPLSLAIQGIERELGVVLFNRTKRKVELTAAGEQFLQEAQPAIAQFNRAVDTARRAARGETGTVRLNYVTSLPLIDVFTRAIRRFRTANPEVHLELGIRTTQQIVDAVLLKSIDVGFIRPALHTILPRSIRVHELFTDRLKLVLPVDHPLAAHPGPVPVKLLRNEPFVLRPRGTGAGFYEQVFALCAEAGFVPEIVQEAEEAATILGLTAAGVGLTIAPEALGAIRISDIVWKELDATSDLTSRVIMISNAEAQNGLRDRFLAEMMR